VVNTGSSAQVWIVRDGKAEPRAVEVARFADDKAILAKGVNEGESVVVAGTSRLVAGMAVTPQAIRPAVEQR
jgi:multidrug efflux pump subunit AcrA (membrane-fusion protein)